jgi:hypothetical protein
LNADPFRFVEWSVGRVDLELAVVARARVESPDAQRASEHLKECDLEGAHEHSDSHPPAELALNAIPTTVI